MNLVLEAGAEDVVDEAEIFQVMTAPETFTAVRDALEKRDSDRERARSR